MNGNDNDSTLAGGKVRNAIVKATREGITGLDEFAALRSRFNPQLAGFGGAEEALLAGGDRRVDGGRTRPELGPNG